MAKQTPNKIWIPEAAFFDPRLDSDDKVLLAEVDRLNSGFGCIIEDGYFARMFRTSRTKVAGRISSLTLLGHIEQSQDNKGNRMLSVGQSSSPSPEGQTHIQESSYQLPKSIIPCKLDARGIPIVQLPDVLKKVPGFVDVWETCLGHWHELHLNLTEKVIAKKLERLEDQLDPCETVRKWNIKSLKALGRIKGKGKKGTPVTSKPMFHRCSECGKEFEKESDMYGHNCPKAISWPEFLKEQLAEIGRYNQEQRRRIKGGFETKPPNGN